MATVYSCGSARRRILVRDAAFDINGIDYLEVYVPPTGSAVERHTTLILTCVRTLSATDYTPYVSIEGGVRVTDPEVVFAVPLTRLAMETASSLVLSPAEQTELANLATELGATAAGQSLVVRTASDGDYSTYTLRIAWTPSGSFPQMWDIRLNEVAFSFKIDCPSDLDCKEAECAEEAEPAAPPIDYLSKDYNSFRRLMLDRMSLLLPDWKESSPADLGVTLVELLAQAGDHLSYYQDAVGTEAYLRTARRRPSIRRHARLLDYHLHEGVNARTWVTVEVDSDVIGTSSAPALAAGTALLTRLSGTPIEVRTDALNDLVLLKRPTVFETLHAVGSLRTLQNELRFFTWGDDNCCLPAGATAATLLADDGDPALQVGDVLILEEVRGVDTGVEADADPTRRQAVRLTSVGAVTLDPVTTHSYVDIEWHSDDALTFPLCLTEVADPSDSSADPVPVSVARGNVVLADHGRTIVDEALDPADVPTTGRYRPLIEQSPVTVSVEYDHDDAIEESAAAALVQDARTATAEVELDADGWTWSPVRDLLASDGSAPEFVAEVQTNGRTRLRFGDGICGREPDGGATFTLTYRVGNGQAGNIGSDALAHVVSDSLGGVVTRVRNPLPASGGTDPEPVEQVRHHAPQAFRTQERAVTEADYTEVLGRHPDVQQAVATKRWTGSWYTVFISVDPRGASELSEELKATLLEWLERFRLAGYDLHMDGPQYVALDLELRVCVKIGHVRATVKEELLRRLGTGVLEGGALAFFHADHFSFGDPVYESRLLAEAMKVTGVDHVSVERLDRWDGEGSLASGVLPIGRLEIARLDNDPNQRENGVLSLVMEGGI